jgi:hypothetical protein
MQFYQTANRINSTEILATLERVLFRIKKHKLSVTKQPGIFRITKCYLIIILRADEIRTLLNFSPKFPTSK